jgi:ADP-ribose pyrophosphatase
MNTPVMKKEDAELLLDRRFVKVYDLRYNGGNHYYNASRRDLDDLCAYKSDEEFKVMQPDAVSCIIIVRTPGDEPRILLSYEYRYPAGRFLLGPVAGLIDPADAEGGDAVLTAARREIHEESGITIGPEDKLRMVNPFALSTPGMTDESNAIICAYVDLPDLSSLSQDGAEGTEQFNGFRLYSREEAAHIWREGRDEYGNPFSLMTWAMLAYFISGEWEQYTERSHVL